jgi:hypothetical protein
METPSLNIPKWKLSLLRTKYASQRLPASKSTLAKSTSSSPNSQQNQQKLPGFQQLTHVILYMSAYQFQRNRQIILDFIDFLQKNNKIVHSIIVYQTRDSKAVINDAGSDTTHLILKDFNYYGVPKTEIAKKAVNRNADLFINLDPNGGLTMLGCAAEANTIHSISPYQAQYQSFFNILLKESTVDDLYQYLCSIKSFFSHLS